MVPDDAPTAIRRLVLTGLRVVLGGLWVVLGLLAPASAEAYWQATGSGTGSASAATMPAGAQPVAAAAGQSVTVTWAQSTLNGGLLGSVTGGGYTVARYPQGSSSPATIGAACATRVSGPGASLQCVEATVAYGAWQYTVTPVLGTSFTGTGSAKSVAVTVSTAAPVLTAVAATNPASGQATGEVQLTWSAVTGATGYNVYRRTAAGASTSRAPSTEARRSGRSRPTATRARH